MTAPMPETMSPREKVRKAIIDVMKPHDADVTLGRVDLTADAILAALASSGDHAELALMANAALEIYSDDVLVVGGTRRIHADNIILYVKNGVDALIAEVAALRGERDQIAGESIWWKGVIGVGAHQPSGEVRSIKHLHPAMVKPIYDAHKGTAVADVIAGLIFSLAINQNREQFLVSHANDRATEAERKLAEAVGRQLPDISNDGPHKIDDHRYWLARQLLDSKLTADEAYSIVRHFPGISKEAERG